MNKREEVFYILILLFFCFVLFFFHLGARPLWDTDEGMHASTSKDMVLTGDWITPTYNGENFYDKPVLHNWFVSLSFLIFGFTEFAARLPAAILGLGGVVLTYLLGRMIFGPMTGFLGGTILATNVEYTLLSRSVIHDISLAFFMTLALLLFYMGWTDGRNRKKYFLFCYASLGFAVLAKGPVGIVLPGLIIGLFLLLKKRLDFLREMEIGWGILIFLGVAAPWYVLISLRNQDYGAYFFVYNNVMRFLSSKAQHHQRFYYYFAALLGGFFPWSCFLPLSLYRLFRRGLQRMKDGSLFLLLWFLVIFLFFTLASSKLSTYILPLFPAASLLAGSLWSDLMEAPTPGFRKGFLSSFIPLIAVLPLTLLYLWIGPPTYYAAKHGIDFLGHAYLVFWVAGGSALSFYLAFRKDLRASFFALAGTVVSVMVFFELTIVPSINPYFTTKELARRLDRMVPPGEKLVFINSEKDTALFYTGRKARILRTPQETIDFLSQDKKVFCIVNRSLYRDLDKVKKMSYIIGEEGGKLIISNRR
jgi:4-amino-4-deoxy-L-arabinose transferase-like glycosyltransferase